MEIYSYTGACDYLISDRKTPPQYVKTATQNARGDLEYTFTSDVAEAARFDRLAAITSPIVEAQHTPSFFFDLAPQPDEDDTMCECNNCGWEGPIAALHCRLREIPDLFERIEPGETVPAGECPECGALASVKVVHVIKEE